MYTYILSMLIVTIISSCFYGKKTWDNRYFILFIGIGVAIITTLIINYSIKSNDNTKLVEISNKPIELFAISDNYLTVDDNDNYLPIVTTDSFNFNNHNIEYYQNFNDGYDTNTIYSDSSMLKMEISKTLIFKKIPFFVIFYYEDNDLYVAYNMNGSIKNKEINNLCFDVSVNDTLAYITKENLLYDVSDYNRWINQITIPKIKTIETIHLPLSYYESIPDSLINKPKN